MEFQVSDLLKSTLTDDNNTKKENKKENKKEKKKTQK